MKNRPAIIICLVLGLLLVSCSSQPSLLEEEEWDLVWISDSSGWGVAEIYAAMVEEDTGVKINVYDNWMGGLRAVDVYSALKGEPTSSLRLERLADEIREAEIVVFFANSRGSDDEGAADYNCVEVGTFYVNTCPTFNTYIEHLESIYKMIFELRDGQPTIVRAYDA